MEEYLFNLSRNVDRAMDGHNKIGKQDLSELPANGDETRLETNTWLFTSKLQDKEFHKCLRFLDRSSCGTKHIIPAKQNDLQGSITRPKDF